MLLTGFPHPDPLPGGEGDSLPLSEVFFYFPCSFSV
jgi:hypothetical protein